MDQNIKDQNIMIIINTIEDSVDKDILLSADELQQITGITMKELVYLLDYMNKNFEIVTKITGNNKMRNNIHNMIEAKLENTKKSLSEYFLNTYNTRTRLNMDIINKIYEESGLNEREFIELIHISCDNEMRKTIESLTSNCEKLPKSKRYDIIDSIVKNTKKLQCKDRHKIVGELVTAILDPPYIYEESHTNYCILF